MLKKSAKLDSLPYRLFVTDMYLRLPAVTRYEFGQLRAGADNGTRQECQ